MVSVVRSGRCAVLTAVLAVCVCLSGCQGGDGTQSPSTGVPVASGATTVAPHGGIPVSMSFYGSSYRVTAVGMVPTVDPGRPGGDVQCADGVETECSLLPPEGDVAGTVGWYRDSASPGSGDEGTVVMVSHVNYGGVDGVGRRWVDLSPGDVVDVTTATGVVSYRVDSGVELVPKNDPVAFREFGDRTFNRMTGGEQLVLVTCAGRFVPGSEFGYEDNGVVVLSPV